VFYWFICGQGITVWYLLSV